LIPAEPSALADANLLAVDAINQLTGSCLAFSLSRFCIYIEREINLNLKYYVNRYLEIKHVISPIHWIYGRQDLLSHIRNVKVTRAHNLVFR
jgi:hypothetical protein